MYQLATAPRGIGQVLDSTFQLARASYLALLPYAVITGLGSGVPFIYLLWTGALDDPAQLATFELAPGYWISSLVTLPLLLWTYGAAIVRSEAVAHGQAVGFGESFGKVLPQLITFVVAMILYMLAVGVGMVLLVIPGLLLLLSLCFFLPAIALDGKGIFDSLTYSHKLVWGSWWRTFAIFFIALIIIYVFFLLIGVFLGIFAGFGGGDVGFFFLANMVTSVLGGMLVMPLFTSLYVEIYRDLKMRKSGGDLAARIEAVGTAR